jgi:hypothetical protein
VVGTELGEADNVVADDTHAYWMSPRAGTSNIYRIKLAALGDGGTAEPVATNLAGADLFTANADALFWRSGKQVLSIAKTAPGTPAVIASVPGSENLHTFTVDDNYVYYTRRAGGATPPVTVQRVVIGGDAGAPQQLLQIPSSAGTPGALSADGADLYFFNDASTTTAMLLKLPAAGGAGTPLTAQNQFRPGGITFDKDFLYWTAGGVFRARRNGNGATLLASRGNDELSSVAVDDAYVYWTVKSTGAVRRVPKGGGTAVTLARMGTADAFVTIAGPWLVWTSDGRLRALRR